MVSYIDALLEQPEIDWQQILKQIISAYDCTTGTIHLYDKSSKLLKLKAYQGIPEFLIPVMSEIPIGKGMAGIAAERREPVEMCNLQTDKSGVARPGAKETKVEGSIAIPLLFKEELYGTLGIAKSISYNFKEDEINSLMEIGKKLSNFICNGIKT